MLKLVNCKTIKIQHLIWMNIFKKNDNNSEDICPEKYENDNGNFIDVQIKYK